MTSRGSIQTSRRVSELLLDLLCRLEPSPQQQQQQRRRKGGGDSNGEEEKAPVGPPSAALSSSLKKYAAVLKKHTYVSPNEAATLRSFDGLVEKLALSGRISDSVALRQYKDLFLAAYAESQASGRTGVAAYDCEFSVPHAMLQVLLLLASAPTQSVQGFRVHEPNMKLLAPSGLPIAEEGSDTDGEEGVSEEDDAGILGYDDWRRQCKADDDAELASEADSAWNATDDEDDADHREHCNDIASDGAKLRPEPELDDGYDGAGLHEDRNMEYLRYGLHVSQRGVLASELYGDDAEGALERYEALEVPLFDDLTHQERVQWVQSTRVPHHEDDLVLRDVVISKYILEMLSGYQNDLFVREEGKSRAPHRDVSSIGSNTLGAISGIGELWSKSSTCLRVAAIGVTQETCQVVLDWFVRFANDIQYCRTVVGAVMEQVILPIGVDTQKLAVLTGKKLNFAEKTLLDQLIAHGGDSLIPLYASVYDELAKIDAFIAEFQLRLHKEAQDGQTQDLSIAGLYLAMKSRRSLFSSMKGSLQGVLLAIDHYSDAGSNSLNRQDGADFSTPYYTPHHKASVDDLLPALLQFVLEETSASWVVNKGSLDIKPHVSGSSQAGEDEERDCCGLLRTNPPFDEKESNLALDLSFCEAPLWSGFCAGLIQKLIDVDVASISVHAGQKLSRKGSVNARSALTSQSARHSGGLVLIWNLAMDCELDFDVIAKFPIVLNRIVPAASNTVANFKSIATNASKLFKMILGSERDHSTPSALHTDVSLALRNVMRLRDAKSHQSLFRNDPDELVLMCTGASGSFKSAESDDSSDQQSRTEVKSIETALNRGEFSILGGVSLLSIVILRPLVSMIQSVAALAATAVVEPRGFNLLGHLEYLRLLFFMGGEVFGRETDKFLGASQAQSTKSPGSVLVTIQETYKSLLRRYATEQHNSAFSGEIFLQLRSGAKSSGSTKRSRPLNFEVELYSASVSLTNTLQQTISTCTDGGATTSGVQRGGAAVSSIAVAASFTPTSAALDDETSVSKSQTRNLKASVLPSNAAASLYLSDLMCDNLSIDMSYPFPLNKVISPDRVRRMMIMYRYLLKISCWLYAAEETWKMDSVSLKALTTCCATGWPAGSASMLVDPLNRCRVSLYWLLHTVKGIQYYFLSDIHDVMWPRLQAEIASAAELSTAHLVHAFDNFLSGVERLLALYESQVMEVLKRGHAAVSAFQLALLLCDSIFETYGKRQEKADAPAEGVKSVLLSRCALLLKKADTEFASARDTVTSFLAILAQSSGEGYRSGVVSRLRRYNELNTVDMSIMDVANETRKLSAILGGHWNTHPGFTSK